MKGGGLVMFFKVLFSSQINSADLRNHYNIFGVDGGIHSKNRDVEKFSECQTFGLTNLENLSDRMKTCQTKYKFYIVAHVISHFD